MPSILAIDTSTLTASVALLRDNVIVLAKESSENAHSESVLAFIDECLQAGNLTLGELDTIAVGAGPGSFTGLRIGMATVKGLCFATGVSLTPVSSLAALAFECSAHCPDDAIIASILDARRKEVFVGLFAQEGDSLRSIGEEQVLAPADVEALLAERLTKAERKRVVLCGDGASKYEDIVAACGPRCGDATLTPTASAVAALARNLPALDALASAKPTYVRLPEAEIKFPNGNTGGTFSMPTKASASQPKKP